MRPVDVAELGPFWSGAVGYLGYDCVRYLERLPSAPPKLSIRLRSSSTSRLGGMNRSSSWS